MLPFMVQMYTSLILCPQYLKLQIKQFGPVPQIDTKTAQYHSPIRINLCIEMYWVAYSTNVMGY